MCARHISHISTSLHFVPPRSHAAVHKRDGGSVTLVAGVIPAGSAGDPTHGVLRNPSRLQPFDAWPVDARPVARRQVEGGGFGDSFTRFRSLAPLSGGLKAP